MPTIQVSSVLTDGTFTFDLTRDPDDLDDPRTTEEDARRYFSDTLGNDAE